LYGNPLRRAALGVLHGPAPPFFIGGATLIHPNDEPVLLAITGQSRVSEEIAAEYEIRIGMYHRAGGSGHLGVIGLIDLVRSVGITPIPIIERPKKVDWRKYPQNGSTRVEARFFGTWQPGAFLGFVEAGTLAVRLDDDVVVKECRSDMVRLAQDQSPRRPVVEPERDTVSRSEDKPEYIPLEKMRSLLGSKIIDEPSEPDDGPEEADQPDVDINSISPGSRLWVALDGDVKGGTLISSDGDMVEVNLDGETKTQLVGADAVTVQ